MTHICVSNLNIMGSDNGLLPGWHQGIIWTNAGILLIGPLGRNFGGILIEIDTFSFQENSFENIVWKWRPFYLSLNVLIMLTEQQWDYRYQWCRPGQCRQLATKSKSIRVAWLWRRVMLFCWPGITAVTTSCALSAGSRSEPTMYLNVWEPLMKVVDKGIAHLVLYRNGVIRHLTWLKRWHCLNDCHVMLWW